MLVSQLLVEEEEEKLSSGIGVNTLRRGTRTATVASQFRRQLDDLMSMISVCDPSYVRCIKPNNAQQASNFDTELVREQLKYLGMLETIKVCSGTVTVYVNDNCRYAKWAILIGSCLMNFMIDIDVWQVSM
jgi:myosin heavy subunit